MLSFVDFLKWKTEESTYKSDKRRKKGDDAGKLSPPSKRYDHYKHPTEEQHRTAEQFSWRDNYRLNIGIAIAAVIAAIFASGSFYETRRQADIAQQGLISSTRAWVDVDVNSATVQLRWNGDIPIIGAEVNAVNEGRSPALNVISYPVIYMRVSGTLSQINNLVYDLCHQSRVAYGNTVFVKETSGSFIFAPLRIRYSYMRKWLGLHGRTFGKGATPIPLALAVCANYQVVGDTRLHYIAKLFDIDARTSTYGGMPRLGENLPEGQVVLTRQGYGEYAD